MIIIFLRYEIPPFIFVCRQVREIIYFLGKCHCESYNILINKRFLDKWIRGILNHTPVPSLEYAEHPVVLWKEDLYSTSMHAGKLNMNKYMSNFVAIIRTQLYELINNDLRTPTYKITRLGGLLLVWLTCV